jgi:hypothetical protein
VFLDLRELEILTSLASLPLPVPAGSTFDSFFSRITGMAMSGLERVGSFLVLAETGNYIILAFC